MKGIIIGVGCFSLGLLSAKIVDNYNRKQLLVSKEIIDTLFNDEVISMIEEIENDYYKQLFFETYCSLIKEGYVTDSITEVTNIRYRLDLLLDRIRSYKEENSVSDVINNEGEQNDDDSDLSSYEEIKEESNEIVSESGKEGDDKDDINSIKNDTEDVSEHHMLDYREEVLDEELQPPEESQEDVQIEISSEMEEQAVSEENHEDEVDEEAFTKLVRIFISPLLEKYGDEYEDRLVKMAGILSSISINEDVYDEYTTKFKAILHYQNGDKGKRKLNETISNFFSIFPSGSDTCEE